MTAAKDNWVVEMADTLAREILEQLAGIRLSRCSVGSVPPYTPAPRMDGVYGHVEGAYRMELFFCAEPSLFQRLACNMIGAPAEDEEVQEYAAEFVNMLCGRFISEIYRATKISARFFPTQYQPYPYEVKTKDGSALRTLYYISEEQETAEFSWTEDTIELLLKERRQQ